MPPAHTPSLPPTSLLYMSSDALLQSMNQQWHVIITQSPQFMLQFTLGVAHSMGFNKCMMTCTPPQTYETRIFIHCQKKMWSAYTVWYYYTSQEWLRLNILTLSFVKCKHLCNPNPSLPQKVPTCSFLASPCLHPQRQAPLLFVLELHITRIIRFLLFCVCLLTFNVNVWRLTHIVIYTNSLSFTVL